MITLRLRTSQGTTRLANVPLTTTIEELRKNLIPKHLGIKEDEIILSTDPQFQTAVADEELTLKELSLKNGAMFFVKTRNGEVPTLPNAATKAVDTEGNIVQSVVVDPGAFRPGVSSLRSQKLHWTLTEMTELEDQYTFVIKGKEPLFCANASLDFASAQSFQDYCRVFGFLRPRCSYLYGRFLDTEEEVQRLAAEKEEQAKNDKKYGNTKGRMRVSDFKAEDDGKPKKRAVIDALYDPVQSSPDGVDFAINDANGIERADKIAKALGMQRVGFMFAHPPNRTNFHFSANEIVSAGLGCLEATDGARDSPFVCIKVTPNESGVAQMDAFQLTKTCLDMVAEDALLRMPGHPGFVAVREKFQAVVEAKAAEVIDTDFLIKRVPILPHQGPLVQDFPKLNRDQVTPLPNAQALKQLLDRKKNNLRAAFKDFNLLLFLAANMDEGIIMELIQDLQVSPPEDPLPEGFVLMIRAGFNL